MQFRHAKQSRDRDALRYEGPKLVVSVVVFLGVSAIIPLYNKVVFEGAAGDKGFPYPLTMTFLQLGFTAVALTIGEVFRRFWRLAWARRDQDYYHPATVLPTQNSALLREGSCSSITSTQSEFPCGHMASQDSPDEAHEEHTALRIDRTTFQGQSVDSLSSLRPDHEEMTYERLLEQSWIFGPDLWYKMRITMPIGTLFGAKYAVTNWGLKLVPLAPHLLLQATDLMFTVVFAHMINRERLNRLELISCIGSTFGTVLVAYRTNQLLPPGTGLYAVTINLISPVLLGLCVTLLRKASHHLLVREAGPLGRVPGMNPVELTAIKLWWSCAVIFPFVILFEDGGLQRLGISAPSSNIPVSVFAQTESPGLFLAALGGGVFILVFQVNMTWMSTMATAVTVGVIGSLKVFPQWVVAILYAGNLDLSLTNVTGAFLLLLFCTVWAYSRYDAAITDSRLQYTTKPTKRRSSSIRRHQARVHRNSKGYGSIGTGSNASSLSETTALLAKQAPA